MVKIGTLPSHVSFVLGSSTPPQYSGLFSPQNGYLRFEMFFSQVKAVLQFLYCVSSSHRHVGILMIENIKSVKQKKERIIEEDE
jgi:hypothetical protein